MGGGEGRKGGRHRSGTDTSSCFCSLFSGAVRHPMRRNTPRNPMLWQPSQAYLSELENGQAGRRAGGQAGRRAGGQAGRRAGGQAGRRAGGQAGRRAGGQAGRRAGGQAGRRAGGQAGRRAGGQAGRRAGGQAGRRAGGRQSCLGTTPREPSDGHIFKFRYGCRLHRRPDLSTAPLIRRAFFTGPGLTCRQF